jgi:hypothetical protein
MIAGKEQKMSSEFHQTHWLLWPFVALWRILALFIGLTGRLIAIILGAVLVIAGIVVSLTVIGAIVGVPLIILGGLIILRGIF